jgi:hypothetical protein
MHVRIISELKISNFLRDKLKRIDSWCANIIVSLRFHRPERRFSKLSTKKYILPKRR